MLKHVTPANWAHTTQVTVHRHYAHNLTHTRFVHQQSSSIAPGIRDSCQLAHDRWRCQTYRKRHMQHANDGCSWPVHAVTKVVPYGPMYGHCYSSRRWTNTLPMNVRMHARIEHEESAGSSTAGPAWQKVNIPQQKCE
jgi:hypothetical protein